MPTISMLNVKDDDDDEIMEDDDQVDVEDDDQVDEEEDDDQEEAEEESEEEYQRASESENEEEEEEEDEDDGESNVSRKSEHEDTVESTANSSSSNSITVTLTDPDVLDCPICFLPLTIPVFQCDNGHIACSSCCSIMIKNVCPTCSLPIGYNRCRAIEKVFESIKISCTNIAYGCKERISYNKKLEHEQMCIHEPCSCPHPGCDFVASSKLLYLHYYSKHLNSAIPFNYNTSFIVPVKKGMGYVILQESVDKTLFVLKYGVESIGNVANITCIAPSSVKKGFSYELVAFKGDSKIKLESLTESIPRWSQYLPNGTFLLVPSNFLDSSGGHFLHVRISSGGKGKL